MTTMFQMRFKKTFNNFYISSRFQQVVVLHVLKNYLKRVNVQVPLLLGVHGPSGEGKTFQLEQILKDMGVKRFLISGGQFESKTAGQSAHIVRDTYLRASDDLRGGGCSLAVVLINDIDTGLGNWGDEGQYSINQQSVFGDLMHLVDYPTSVEGRDTARIPVIITGNDFTKLYDPLVRAGRMTSFEWIPNFEERVETVSLIFPEIPRHEVERLIIELNRKVKEMLPSQVRDLPIAFYSHLRSSMLDDDLWAETQSTGLYKITDLIVTGKEPEMMTGVNYERIFNKGIEIALSGQLVNHLKSGI